MNIIQQQKHKNHDGIEKIILRYGNVVCCEAMLCTVRKGEVYGDMGHGKVMSCAVRKGKD